MKSPMVTNADYIKPDDKGKYTDLQVLKSGGGYYIGTMYEERDEKGEITWREPGSRDSDYFRTREGAEAYLKILKVGSDKDAEAVLRPTP